MTRRCDCPHNPASRPLLTHVICAAFVAQLIRQFLGVCTHHYQSLSYLSSGRLAIQVTRAGGLRGNFTSMFINCFKEGVRGLTMKPTYSKSCQAGVPDEHALIATHVGGGFACHSRAHPLARYTFAVAREKLRRLGDRQHNPNRHDPRAVEAEVLTRGGLTYQNFTPLHWLYLRWEARKKYLLLPETVQSICVACSFAEMWALNNMNKCISCVSPDSPTDSDFGALTETGYDINSVFLHERDTNVAGELFMPTFQQSATGRGKTNARSL